MAVAAAAAAAEAASAARRAAERVLEREEARVVATEDKRETDTEGVRDRGLIADCAGGARRLGSFGRGGFWRRRGAYVSANCLRTFRTSASVEADIAIASSEEDALSRNVLPKRCGSPQSEMKSRATIRHQVGTHTACQSSAAIWGGMCGLPR